MLEVSKAVQNASINALMWNRKDIERFLHNHGDTLPKRFKRSLKEHRAELNQELRERINGKPEPDHAN